MEKKQTINKTLRFDKKQIDKAELLAADEKRSFNNWVEWLIDKEIKSKLKNTDNKTD